MGVVHGYTLLVKIRPSLHIHLRSHRAQRFHPSFQCERVYRPVGVATLQQNVLFGSHHEEGRTEREHEEAPKIDITPIHDVERAGLGKKFIQDVDVRL